jgi:UDP-N-acetylglucosamine--N-acetylmuramyl-(pentapeptide) pyrophosphoryl-undecaprenol N-acetylglucosamine transferase
VVPALAVAEALRAAAAEVSFIGGDRAERDLVPAAGFELRCLDVEGLDRRNVPRAARALLKSGRAALQARAWLRELQADAVMGGGGYVAAPVVLAAATLRVPVVLTEADSHLGITNRALAPLARRVCLAFELPGRTGPRYRVTGRPVPAPSVGREEARAQLGIEGDRACMLVFGGSLGARSINEATFEAFAQAPIRVLHVSGKRDYPQLAQRSHGNDYELIEYLDSERFAVALAASDLVIARSGGSIFEIAAHGRPAVLIPYPHAAAQHQAANAAWMQRAGAACVIADEELNAGLLAETVASLLGDPPRLHAMALASAALARPHAASDVATELLEAARG